MAVQRGSSRAPRWRFAVPADTPPLLKALAPVGILVNNAINKATYHGAENVPSSGGAIFVSNHTAHLDFLSVGAALYQSGRAPCFSAGSDFFRIPVLGAALRGVGAIDVPKDAPNASGALVPMRDALDEGRSLLVFPEGTFTRDPQLWPMRGKTGVARLAKMRPEVPVIPVAHWGNEAFLNPWDKSIDLSTLRCQLDVSFGAPIELAGAAEVRAGESEYEALTRATGYMMDAIEAQLVPLREANPAGFGTEPRPRRWDRKIDGDPNAEKDSENRAKRREYIERREKRKTDASRRVRRFFGRG